ncbi:hypothetical protein EVAR_59020_1 [Eumeta japonica]|uniref:Uncharacterized protein n=1 Tax=Eumeta variegata TaxID=151549 RepID=A0A4C1ZFK5_EUMVA|nr:hypothetical protein EVAR_59020_1 [Eumeta japonica]
MLTFVNSINDGLYRTVNKTALPVFAGVMPAYLEVICAGKIQWQRENITEAEADWIDLEYQTSHILSGHGYFRKRLI